MEVGTNQKVIASNILIFTYANRYMGTSDQSQSTRDGKKLRKDPKNNTDDFERRVHQLMKETAYSAVLNLIVREGIKSKADWLKAFENSK